MLRPHRVTCLVVVLLALAPAGARLRSLSALVGTAAIPVAYAAGAELRSRATGLAVAALAATGPLLVWYSQEPSRNSLLAIPVAMSGIIFISGVLESGAYGSDPKRGAIYGLLTGIAYSGFLLAMRRGSGERGRVAGPLYDATVASTICIVPIGLVIGDLDFTPGPEATAWLIVLALSSQVVGWLLITVSLGRLPTARTSVLLTLQPLLAVIFAALIVDERPSPLQLVGAAMILSGLLIASVGTRRTSPLETVPEH